MHTRSALSAIALAVTSLAQAAPSTYPLDDIVVTATRTPLPDVAAPYASEVYTQAMIQASGASSLVDFLTQNTTLDVVPNYGNKFTPTLDMRGYGLTSGYQNIVVSLDGQRLNNIDLMPQLLGAIPPRQHRPHRNHARQRLGNLRRWRDGGHDPDLHAAL